VSPVNGAGGISTVLRKVQLVHSGSNGSYGVGGGGTCCEGGQGQSDTG
jgi:hypothetical protein